MRYAMATEPYHDDDPITLHEAARIVFRGTVSAAVLRREIDTGRLEAFKVGRRYFVTLAAVRAMRERCRVQPRAQGHVNNLTFPTPDRSAAAARAAVAALRGRAA
jgi:hypothetical protein